VKRDTAGMAIVIAGFVLTAALWLIAAAFLLALVA
jgi:hypothetical protein